MKELSYDLEQALEGRADDKGNVVVPVAEFKAFLARCRGLEQHVREGQNLVMDLMRQRDELRRLASENKPQ